MADPDHLYMAKREFHSHMQAVIETAVDAIVTIEVNGLIAMANPACVRLFGYTQKELVGQNVKLLMPEPDHGLHDGYLESYVRSGVRKIIGIGREVVGRHKNGTVFPVDLAVSEVRIDGRRFFTGILRDLTERVESARALELERLRAETYLAVAGVMIVALDAGGRVSLINPKGCEILGRPKSEIVGTDWFEHFLPELERRATRELFDSMMAGAEADTDAVEGGILTAAGELRTISWHNSIVRDSEGGAIGTLSSGSDVTDQRRLSAQLLEQQSLARLGEMAAVVAHEVKNPLAGISGALRIISGHLDPASEDRGILSEIQARLYSLNESVDDLLVFARPQRPVPKSIPLHMLLEACVALLAEDPDLAEVEVTLEGPDLLVRCDSELIKSVIQNLLLNAAQAMKRRGRIRVITEARGAGALVSVSDDGPGVPEDERERIFEPFFTTKTRGTGLGLAIARRVLVAHGGEIALSSSGAGGATFELRLPLVRKR